MRLLQGSRGAGGAIPPDAVRLEYHARVLICDLIDEQDLVFDVELLGIKNKGPKVDL